MMETNSLPKFDMSDNPTNCCPRFDPTNWDNQELHFDDKLFLKAKTKSIFHIPLNFGKVFPKTFSDIEKAEAFNEDDYIVLSYDPSNWVGEHYFSVSKDVPGHEMVKLSGDYVTKVFEGPFNKAPKWEKEMDSLVKENGKKVEKTFFFYTTCPKCAKEYGKNYVVAVSQLQ